MTAPESTPTLLAVALIAAGLTVRLQRDLRQADARRRYREALRLKQATDPLRGFKVLGKAMTQAFAQMAKALKPAMAAFAALDPAKREPEPHRWWSSADPRPCLCPGCESDRARRS